MATATVDGFGVYAEGAPTPRVTVDGFGVYAEIRPPAVLTVDGMGVYVELVASTKPTSGGFTTDQKTIANPGTGTAPSPSKVGLPTGASAGSGTVQSSQAARPTASAPTASILPDPSLQPPDIAATGRVGYVQFRAFLGPLWRKVDESGHWDFSVLNLAAFTPHASTTVASGVGASDTSVTLTSASTWPTSGTVWLGPNGTGQSWGLATYSGRTGNALTGLTRDVLDSEYTGIHSAGAAAHFWFPLSNNDGRMTYQESMDDEMASITWRLELSGVNVDPGVLRPGTLVLVQTRDVVAGAWGAWTNFAVGWVLRHSSADDHARQARWSLTAGGLDALPLAASVTGLRVGEQDLADSASVQADSTLSPLYKAIGDGTGEVTSTVTSVAPGLAVDGSLVSGWINDRYIGEHNPHHAPASEPLDAVLGNLFFSQVHISKYPGQGAGYRWLEITFLADANAGAWVIAGIDHMVRFEDGIHAIGALDYTAGDRIILAENPSLFQAENPNHEAAAIIDLRDVELWFMGNRKWQIETAATGGTFTLTVEATTSAPIAYNATPATVQSIVAGLASVGTDNVRVEGVPGNWVLTFINTLGQQWGPWLSHDGSGLTGGSLTVTETSSSVFPFPIGSGEEIFTYLDPVSGLLRLYDGPGEKGESQVAWGNTGHPHHQPMTSWGGASWVGTALPSIGAGETARMVFNPTTPTKSADFWSIGRIATPGYNVLNTDKAWLLLDLPSMGLTLVDAMTDAVPGAGATVAMRNVAGPSAAGLPETGTIQIGNEQITYEDRSFSAGTVKVVARGANSTVAAAHTAGDPILFVVGGVASDAWPVAGVRLRRQTGRAVVQDFVVRSSSLALVRRPDEAGYLADYTTLATVAGNAASVWTLDLSSSPSRTRWLLVEITAMSGGGARARVDEVDVLVDPAVQAPGTQMSSGTIADAIDSLAAQAGIPAGAIVDAGGTLSPTEYTTVGGNLWPILADLASFGGAQIRVGRDSKLTISPSRFLSAITPDGAWTRTQIAQLAGDRSPNLAVGQVQMTWRTPEDPATDAVTYPPVLARTGQVVRAGTFVCADSTVALAEARRRFWQARRPYVTTLALALDGRPLAAGDIYDVTWSYRARTEVRRYVLGALNLAIENYGVESVVTGQQVDREDEK